MTSDATPFAPGTRFFTISTAGHVDHGKTSLLRALTGIDPDRLKEEKERQMTTDLGFAYLKLPGDCIVGFVDVPGHGKFLKNMLAGVGGIDLALLVVAADEGPMPQTRQHVRILSLLGVKRAIVALNKIDTIDDPEHIEIVQEEIADMLADHGIEMIALVPVSSTKGSGIPELKEQLWRTVSTMAARDMEGGAFLPVDRVFTKSGFGTVITGTLVRGKLAAGDQIVVAPDNVVGRVRRLETFGNTVNEAGPGQRVACNVVLKDNLQLTRGHVLLGKEVAATSTLIVSLENRPRLKSKERFAARLNDQPIRLYHGTAECHGYIRWAVEVETEPGVEADEVIAFVALTDALVAQAHDRFVLRLSDDTIYGGEVLLRDRPRWSKRSQLHIVSQKLLKRDYEGAVLDLVNAAPGKLIKKDLISLLRPYPLDEKLIADLLQRKVVTPLGETLMAVPARKQLTIKLTDTIKKLVEQQSSAEVSEGVPLELIRSHLSPKLDRTTFQALIEQEETTAKLTRKADRILLSGRPAGPAVDDKQAQLHSKIAALLEQSLAMEFSEIGAAVGLDEAKVKNALQIMSKGGNVIIINYEFAITVANLQKAHRVLADIWHVKKNIAPSEFREALDTNRRYAMALLQHFDDTKVTRRLQSGRVLLKPPTQ